MKLYRKEFTNINYSVDYKKGDKINLKSYISTSIDENSAKAGNISYEIIVPKGKKAGLYIASLSSHNEKEFLLNKNMWYEVSDVIFESDDGVYKKYILDFIGEEI